MLTPEQVQAAKRALQKLKTEKLFSEIERRLALEKRQGTIADAVFFKLPYRLLYDGIDQPPDEIPLNRYYPHRGQSLKLWEREQGAYQAAKKQSKTGFLTREQIEDIERRYTEPEYTPAADREYYFTCFLERLTPEAAAAYQPWEWTGNAVSEGEAEKIKQTFLSRREHYLQNPEQYAGRFLKTQDTRIYPSNTDYERWGLPVIPDDLRLEGR